jgi:hypothetical protein
MDRAHRRPYNCVHVHRRLWKGLLDHMEDDMTNRHRQRVAAMLSVMFLVPASFKLLNVSIAVEHFTTWGIPMWMMHVIGASELAGAVGLLIARTRLAAAYALFLLMIGGVLTHLSHAEYLFALMPIAYGGGLYLLMKDSLPELLSAHEPIRGLT